MKFQSSFTDFRRRRRLLTIFDSMIAADVAKTIVAVLCVLILIILSNKFVSMLAQALEGQIGNETIFTLLGLRSISIGIGFLPPAVFAAVLMVLGRMYRDSEMAALAAGGVGLGRIYRYVFVVIGPLSLLSLWLALSVQPWSAREANELLLDQMRTMHLRLVTPGTFNEYKKGDLIFYIESVGTDRTLHNVFVHNRHQEKDGVVVAERGRLEELSGGQYIVLEHGTRYEGTPGRADFEITRFDEYSVRINDSPISTSYVAPEAKPTADLLRSGRPADIAELYQRLSIPFGTLILAVLAIPLSWVAPRGGVYGSLLIAFLIYVIYENLLKISHSWLAKSTFPLWMGDWWVYLTMLTIALVLVTRRLGVSWLLQVLRGAPPSVQGLVALGPVR